MRASVCLLTTRMRAPVLGSGNCSCTLLCAFPWLPHIRTPGYIFGCVGTVERVAGVFRDPELLSYRDEGPRQPLYRVRFLQVRTDAHPPLAAPRRWLCVGCVRAVSGCSKYGRMPFVMRVVCVCCIASQHTLNQIRL